MTTLIDRIETAANRRGTGGITFVGNGIEIRRGWDELHLEARAVAAGLQARGVGVGSHVAILGPTSHNLVVTVQAVWLTGATLVLLPLPMRLASIEAFVGQTRLRVQQADIDLLLVDADLAPFLDEHPDDPPSELLGHIADDAAGYERPDVGPDSLAGMQFTSGSTADPKGVMLPHGTCCANLDAIVAAAGVDLENDVMVSWLPLYHDMGLVGFLMLPMTLGLELVLGAPQDFLAAPGRWMEWISAHRGTITAGPNFSWVLAARAFRQADQLDLSHLRIALNGAEPVDPATVTQFVEAAAPHGFDARAVYPAFGMAELVIGGTFPEPLSGLRTDAVDRLTLEAERYAAPAEDPRAETTRHLAFLGRPVPGLEIRIADTDTGRLLSDREVGELQIRGTSVTPGYYNRPDVNAELFADGWFRTGDLAYTVDGEMVMCGRIKDMIIVGGRNVFPDEIERAVGQVPGVRAGNVIAFGVDGRQGKQSLTVVAEVKGVDPAEVRQAIATRVRETVGVPAKHIALAQPGSLPKTSSGKLQRSLCKQQFETGRLLGLPELDEIS
jgi:fatty-acyl-CoA synthase